MRKFSFVFICIFAFVLAHSLFAKSEMTNNLSSSDLPNSSLLGTNTFIFAAKDGRDFNVALQQESKAQNQSNAIKSKQDKSKKQSWVRFKPVFIYKDDATKQEIFKKAPTLYIVVHHTASEFSSSDLEGEEGKVKLAHALVKNINSVLVDSSGITAVTFLNFMLYKK